MRLFRLRTEALIRAREPTVGEHRTENPASNILIVRQFQKNGDIAINVEPRRAHRQGAW
ncbi:MAG: hypothetical protein JJT95_00975 [Pararhodobacter sp.]|nr:hypothetical protein [Pararhodobacter sp.]